jgi:hypothetical protein
MEISAGLARVQENMAFTVKLYKRVLKEENTNESEFAR